MSAQVVYGCYRNPNASTPVGLKSSRITESAIAAMVKHSFSGIAVCAALLTSALAQSGIRYGVMGIKRQNQIVFPPANGPCPQNRGQTPFSCFDKDCVDTPGPGLCNVQTQQGFPLCGCCTFDEVFCSACGGDAGGGICKGTKTTGVVEIAFQGCPCSNDDGIDPGDGSKICPEHIGDGRNTFTCDNEACGGCTETPGICDKKFPGKDSAGRGFFVRCAGCPAGDITCDTCGGDDGNGRCKGQDGSSVGKPYEGCKCGKSGSTVPPIIIFPFPVPPPFFPPPPPGTPRPKKKCSEVPGDVKCSDCGGKDGWCQEGANAGCMCRDDCPTGDDQPSCSAEDCKGEKDEKCTVGPHVDCACKKDQPKCPEGDDILGCDECGGANEQHKCKGLEDENNKWKDCDCIDISSDNEGYDAFSDADIAMWDRIKAALPPAGSSPDKPREHPSGNPKCGGNQADKIPAKVKTDNGDKSPKDLQYMMREVLCNDKCENPPGIQANAVAATPVQDGCEIAIALPNNVEAYAYRGTHSQGPQWQDCWDSFMNITEKCVKDDPATGWVNGPDDYQFYQSGYRKLNGDGSHHSPFDGNNALPDADGGDSDGSGPGGGSPDSGGSDPVKEIAISYTSPGGNGVQCTADERGGWMADCWRLADKFADDQKICSNDANVCAQPRTNSMCKASGARCDPNGSSTMDISSYCVLTSQSSCAIVLADKLSTFGFDGFYCTTGREIKELISREASADGCGGTPDQGRVALWPVNDGKSMLCMTGSKHPGVCGA